MPEEAVKHTHIGGQAVLEGVMMRGKLNWAIAVRRPDGSIYTEEHDLHSATQRYAWLKWPVIRGIWAFGETMVLAVKAFSISAEQAGETEEEQLSSGEITGTLIFGFLFAILVFIVLPALMTNLVAHFAGGQPFTWISLVKPGRGGLSPVAWNVVDGVLRLTVFFLYIWLVSRIPDIQRVFAYHGAEHKTIHAYEHGMPLDPEHIQQYDTLHVRCGTAFLLMVMVIAILVFSLIRTDVFWVRLASRIVLLPVVAGLAYEVTKWAGSKPENPLVKLVLWPGLQMQRMTTRPPDDGMVEVAVVAMRAVVAREEAASAEAPAVPSGPAEELT